MVIIKHKINVVIKKNFPSHHPPEKSIQPTGIMLSEYFFLRDGMMAICEYYYSFIISSDFDWYLGRNFFFVPVAN